MPLKISLKPHEKIFIDGAVIQNGERPAEFSVLNDVSLLREKDILTESKADTACRQIYLCVQLMYMDPANIGDYQSRYRMLKDEVLAAAPSTSRHLEEIDGDLSHGRYYQALKGARKLMEYEEELIDHARQSA